MDRKSKKQKNKPKPKSLWESKPIEVKPRSGLTIRNRGKGSIPVTGQEILEIAKEGGSGLADVAQAIEAIVPQEVLDFPFGRF